MKYSPEELIKKYIAGTCTEEEEAMVESWHLDDLKHNKSIPSPYKITVANQRMLGTIMSKTAGKNSASMQKLYPYIAAAAVLIFTLAALLYINVNRYEPKALPQSKYASDFNPGGNKATLTLSNGKKILLSDAKSGIIINTSTLAYTDGTELKDPSIKSKKFSNSNESALISTPKGGQYTVVLPDGTKVFLNSASSIKFPAAFEKNMRYVEITGEAYFEVTKMKHKPFRVKSGDQTVEVLGTHFNINAYHDENSIKTTLVEGAVKVISGKSSKLLKPGQQAVLSANKIQLNPDPDMEEITAWKNGYFYFKGSDIETIMRQIARWYNVDVTFEGEIPKRTFTGKIYRNAKASEILDLLSYSNIHFKTTGQKIIVTP